MPGTVSVTGVKTTPPRERVTAASREWNRTWRRGQSNDDRVAYSSEHDLIGNLVPDSFHLPESIASGSKHPLRRFEYFQQLTQPHRPHRGEHIERDTCLDGIHHVTEVRNRLSYISPAARPSPTA